MVNSCFIGKRSGVESSSMTRCPPVFSTRHISDSPLSSPSKLRMPNATVTASKLSSANEREVQSSRANEILSERCARFTFSRPTFIMPSEMSVPIKASGCSSRHARMAKSPVPVATSMIRWGWKGRRYLIAFLRQLRSIPMDRV